MKFGTTKRKLRNIWNNTFLTENDIESMDFQYEKIKDDKLLFITHRNKKTTYYVKEGNLDFDEWQGYWYTSLVLSLYNITEKIIPYIKVMVVPLVPDILAGKNIGDDSLEHYILDSGGAISPPIFFDKGDDKYDLLVGGVNCGYNEHVIGYYFDLNDERYYEIDEEKYVEYKIPYKIIIAISNPAEYF